MQIHTVKKEKKKQKNKESEQTKRKSTWFNGRITETINRNKASFKRWKSNPNEEMRHFLRRNKKIKEYKILTWLQ